MNITSSHIEEHNKTVKDDHQESLDALAHQLNKRNIDINELVEQAGAFQVAIPSWALGAGGTRFGRFAMGGEPRSLEEKIEDVGLLHALNHSSGAISLHIPWDIPEDTAAVKELADKHNLVFDAVNSNTFQDQEDQEHSYKYGSLSHTKEEVREQAIEHNIEVIKYGKALGSKALTVWLADGSNFPGQQNFGKALRNTEESLHKIYDALPDDWQVLIEYKPYEPNFYSMVIPDWGTSFLLANKLGDQAKTLVDLGHHLPNTNIEQIVAILLMEGKLGGFHFNDSKYGDDDLTAGSLKPYQLFLIFNELIEGTDGPEELRNQIAWMIDASHNVKDPLEDLLQSVEAIQQAYVKALLIDRDKLKDVREENDPAGAQEVLQDAFQTDVRPLLTEARVRHQAAADPIQLYRALGVRKQLIEERGADSVATGL
ncbi:TIM barrel protein [Gracilimonas mengyeensis]|uniref:L-rhamnose isomerase / sugar isomerase n=1 Tax=Gracilimonas mengyeensis TaxID=1302730 RepID=A0A521C3T9_9BACT|nr:TIM barrel protein [Gracilimonas mengyeensis]SMO54059.1 L-rhamnose isomerase / sugar isomerase [Gracilimonas mengyeensis]